MQAQAYLSLLARSAAIWNYFPCLNRSRRRHQLLHEDYHDREERNRKGKIFRRFLSRNMMRIDHLGNVGVCEWIILAGIRKHIDEVWDGFMCPIQVCVTEFVSLMDPLIA
jgi:hypothetical protein